MPTYQYVCTDCGEALEVQQSFTDDSLTTCPTCTGRLRKVFNAVGVVFKGSGFYRNDSRAPQSESNGESKSSNDPGGSSEKATADAKSSDSKSSENKSSESKSSESKSSESMSSESKSSESKSSDKSRSDSGTDKSPSKSGSGAGSAKPSASSGSAA